MTKQICPNCQTGADSIKLDPRSVMCPYLSFHNGESCSHYKPIEESEGENDEGV